MKRFLVWMVLGCLCGCGFDRPGAPASDASPLASDRDGRGPVEGPTDTRSARATGKTGRTATQPDDARDGEARLVPFHVPTAQSRDMAPATCAIPGFSPPDDAVVYAAGAYAGSKLDYQIDQSGHQATRIDVAVNDTKQPVVLMLGAYEPTVWNIGWSRGTRIAAVLVSGYHRQVVAGLPASVPRLISTYDNCGPCGYFYLSRDRLDALNPLSRRLLGRPVARAFLAREGVVHVGDPDATELVTDANQSPDRFRDPAAPLAGEAGLRDAVARGLLREARTGDLAAWKDAYDAASRRDSPPLLGDDGGRPLQDRVLGNAYVVLKPMTLPAGLYGAHAATFIVPRGVARPTGNPGHSQILDYNTMSCVGATCRR